MVNIANKVALVVGGASGIGAAIAQGLIRKGVEVVIADVQPAQIHLDVTSLDDWTAAVAEVERLHGGLDLMVNTAGGGASGSIQDISLEDFERTVRLNLTGTFLGIKTCFPAMRRREGGSIVNFASNLAVAAMPGIAPYSASKAAVIQLSRVAALEGAPFKIRVNSVLPGITRTPMTAVNLANPDFAKLAVDPVPYGRAGEAHEVAAAALFLLSDEASYVTGTEITADGGLLASY